MEILEVPGKYGSSKGNVIFWDGEILGGESVVIAQVPRHGSSHGMTETPSGTYRMQLQ